MFQRILRYTTLPKALNENWTRKMPKNFIVGFSGKNQTEGMNLLREAFTDSEVVENSLGNKVSVEMAENQLSSLYKKENQKLFIQEFPYNNEMANKYEDRTNGINLFINFTGIA